MRPPFLPSLSPLEGRTPPADLVVPVSVALPPAVVIDVQAIWQAIQQAADDVVTAVVNSPHGP
jgi:hypothetical protein